MSKKLGLIIAVALALVLTSCSLFSSGGGETNPTFSPEALGTLTFDNTPDTVGEGEVISTPDPGATPSGDLALLGGGDGGTVFIFEAINLDQPLQVAAGQPQLYQSLAQLQVNITADLTCMNAWENIEVLPDNKDKCAQEAMDLEKEIDKLDPDKMLNPPDSCKKDFQTKFDPIHGLNEKQWYVYAWDPNTPGHQWWVVFHYRCGFQSGN